MGKFSKITQSIKKSFNFGFGINNNASPNDIYNQMRISQVYQDLNGEKEKLITSVIQYRSQYAASVQPLARVIEILQNMIINTPIVWKDNEDEPLDFDPIKALFASQRISLMHQSYRDFMCSFIKRLCCMDGVVYVMVEIQNGRILDINVIPSDNILPFSASSANKIITRYTITNILNFRNAVFELNGDGYYECVNIPGKEYRLFASDFVFEDSINGVQINLTKSPLIAIAQELHLYNSAVGRAVSLNNNGLGGGILTIATSIADPDEQMKLKQNYEKQLQGPQNYGKTTVAITTKGLKESADIVFTPFGTKASDFAIQNDLTFAEDLIYGNWNVSTAFAKQEAKYVGNQAESLKQFYELKLIPEALRIATMLKIWLFPLLDLEPMDYEPVVDTSKIDVFMEKQVSFIQNVGDVLTTNEKRERLHYEEMDESKSENDKEEDDLETEDIDEKIAKSLKFLDK